MAEALLVTPAAAARELSCSRSTVYKLLSEGRLPSVRIGTSRRIPMEALRSFVAELADTDACLT